jgi:hypothetical protein
MPKNVVLPPLDVELFGLVPTMADIVCPTGIGIDVAVIIPPPPPPPL